MVKKKEPKKNPILKNLNVLDVVFVLDTTGSMGPYLEEAKRYIREIISNIAKEGDLDIKVGLVCFRDHPPQDDTYVVLKFDLAGIDEFHNNLLPIYASGGGDWPEAVWDGINGVFDFSWRENSDRSIYLVGDSPPHAQCLCGITADHLISRLKELKIEVNAHSIAGMPDTTEAFLLLVTATDGKLSTGQSPSATTSWYTDSLADKSFGITDSFRLVESATDVGINYASAASLTPENINKIVTDSGMSEEEVNIAIKYLNKRGM